MSNSIKLIFDEQSVDPIKMQIQNIARNIHYNIAIKEQQIILKSSKCPEWDSDSPNVLFLQGSDVSFDNTFVTVPKKNLKYFLFAIWKYNKDVVDIDSPWVDRYKFKCKHCNRNKSVTQFDQNCFDYCVDCKVELKVCSQCKRVGATHLFGELYYCDNCVNLDSFCQICEQEHKATRQIVANVSNDYHGSEKYLFSCADCHGKSVEMGKENSYQYKPRKFNFLDYDFKKSKVIKLETPKNNVLYMGTEIESQFYHKKHPNIVLGKILKLNEPHECEMIYAKHDGTIPDPGSEIVTHPMTLNMFRALTWEELFSNIVKPTIQGIGGHIHINKTAFVSPLHVYKFCKFIRTNVDYIQWVAERPLQSEWCKSYSNNGKVTRIAKQFKRNQNNDRYEMINFTPHTIELRFFWSPWNTGMLLKNVEFVDALYNYSRDTKLHFDYKEFEESIHKGCLKYPYLYNFILKRDGSKVFKINAEECNKFVYPSVDIPEPEYTRPYCNWCGEYINGEDVESDGSYYHPDCYAASQEEEEVEPDYEDMD